MPYAGATLLRRHHHRPTGAHDLAADRHRTNPTTGEHLLTPFTSRNGRTWTRGGAWTLPEGTATQRRPQSQGANATRARPQRRRRFDYFRVLHPVTCPAPLYPHRPTAARSGATDKEQ